MKSSRGILHEDSSLVKSSKIDFPLPSMYFLNAARLSFATRFLSQSFCAESVMYGTN
jgi:hypothetical protein